MAPHDSIHSHGLVHWFGDNADMSIQYEYRVPVHVYSYSSTLCTLDSIHGYTGTHVYSSRTPRYYIHAVCHTRWQSELASQARIHCNFSTILKYMSPGLAHTCMYTRHTYVALALAPTLTDCLAGGSQSLSTYWRLPVLEYRPLVRSLVWLSLFLLKE